MAVFLSALLVLFVVGLLYDRTQGVLRPRGFVAGGMFIITVISILLVLVLLGYL